MIGHLALSLAEEEYKWQPEKLYGDKEMEESGVEGKSLRPDLVRKLLALMTLHLFSQVNGYVSRLQ